MNEKVRASIFAHVHNLNEALENIDDKRFVKSTIVGTMKSLELLANSG